jgi:hypothetical protein
MKSMTSPDNRKKGLRRQEDFLLWIFGQEDKMTYISDVATLVMVKLGSRKLV